MALDAVIKTTITHPGQTGIRDSRTPTLITGTYAANDAEYHAMIFNTTGKRYLTYCVDNPSDKDVVVTLYGAPYLTSQVGDAGVFAIGDAITSAAGSYKEHTTNEGAAFYIIRCKTAVASATGTTVSIFANLMA